MFKQELKSARCKGKDERFHATRLEVAEMLACYPARISEWERGTRTPKPLTQEAIMYRVSRLVHEKRRLVRKYGKAYVKYLERWIKCNGMKRE